MSGTLKEIRQLVAGGDARIPAHGYDEPANDGLNAREIVSIWSLLPQGRGRIGSGGAAGGVEAGEEGGG
jgi:hypothetical protein